MTTGPLARYWRILDGDVEPRFLESKRKKVDVDLSSDTEALWRAHDHAITGQSGEGAESLLDLKIELASRMLKSCHLCERGCGVDRAGGAVGHCGVSMTRVSSEFIHMGEERELVPSHTIFLSGCTFDCVFCQNWDISTRPNSGQSIEPLVLAEAIDQRAHSNSERRGLLPRGEARNVNWVGGDPTSHLGYILQTLKEVSAPTPQVWNSNMYLTRRTIDLLNGVVDVYLTDFKYGNDCCASRLSKVDNYTTIMQRNHLDARSTGEMIIRHLVLPSHLDCCTKPVLSWIADNMIDVKVNVMGQYRPSHRAYEYPDISRSLKSSEYEEAISFAEAVGLDLCD